MLTIMAVFAQIEGKRLVKKLAAALKRARKKEGKCEGRKSHLVEHTESVALATKLR